MSRETLHQDSLGFIDSPSFFRIICFVFFTDLSNNLMIVKIHNQIPLNIEQNYDHLLESWFTYSSFLVVT